MARSFANIYRRDRILGHVDEQLNEELFRSWGNALGDLLTEHAIMLVSSDHRTSSQAYKSALTVGLNEQGIRVIDLGTIPSDLASFACWTLNADGYAAVTGQSQGEGWNGLKWLLADNEIGSQAQQVSWLKNWAEKHAKDKAQVPATPRIYRKWDPTFEWISWLQNVWFDTPSVPLKVVIDPLFGCWAGLAVRTLRAVFPSFHFIAIHDEPDERFGGLIPNVMFRDSLNDLSETIRSEKANFGIALDADAGLFRILDNEGVPLSPDEMAWLFIQMLGKSMEGERFLHDKECAQVVLDEGRRYDAISQLVSGDERMFMEQMKRTEALIGFGPDGEIYYRGAHGNRIVIFAICWILDYLAHLDGTLEHWRTQFHEGFFRPEGIQDET